MKRAELINAVYNSMSDLVGDPVAVIGMWSNQLDRLEQELAFELPAIFVEFEDIEWRQMQGGMHTADVGIRIHLITHTDGANTYSIDNKMMERFVLIDRIVDILCDPSYRQSWEIMGITRFQHTGSYTTYYGELMDNTERFVTRITDTTAMEEHASQPVKLSDIRISKQ